MRRRKPDVEAADTSPIVSGRTLGLEPILTATHEEESTMVYGALVDGGKAALGWSGAHSFRFRSDGQRMVWYCGTCKRSGRAKARDGFGVINQHRHEEMS